MTYWDIIKERFKIPIVITICVIAVISVLFLFPGNEEIPEYLPATLPFFDGYYISDEGELYEIMHYPEDVSLTLALSQSMYFIVDEGKIILPPGAEIIDTEHNFFRCSHIISLDGVDLPRRIIPSPGFSPIVTQIILSGNTIRLRANRGILLRVGYTEAYTYIELKDLRDIYHTIVVIDPGHGGRDPGAPSVNRGGPYEAEVNLSIALVLLEIFDKPGVLLVPTRTEDVFVYNGDRYSLVNFIGDYFISIHANADGRSSLSRGTLTLYGYAEGSSELGNALQNAMVALLGSRDRGVNQNTAVRVLGGSTVPSALVELLFMSNPDDAAMLSDPRVQRRIAETFAEVIADLPRAR